MEQDAINQAATGDIFGLAKSCGAAASAAAQRCRPSKAGEKVKEIAKCPGTENVKEEDLKETATMGQSPSLSRRPGRR